MTDQQELDAFRKKWREELQAKGSLSRSKSEQSQRDEAEQVKSESASPSIKILENCPDTENPPGCVNFDQKQSGGKFAHSSNKVGGSESDGRDETLTVCVTATGGASGSASASAGSEPGGCISENVCTCSRENVYEPFRIAEGLLRSSSCLSRTGSPQHDQEFRKHGHGAEFQSDTLNGVKLSKTSRSDGNTLKHENKAEKLLSDSVKFKSVSEDSDKQICDICKKIRVTNTTLSKNSYSGLNVKRSKNKFKVQQEAYKLSKRLKVADEAREKSSADQTERFLDSFIADLDEINEIPFFDISIPREIAVKMFIYLDMVSLCRCAQVSRSWKHLAEDELLWSRICHKLGYEKSAEVLDHSQWKSIVREYVEGEKKLDFNWKNRVGRVYTSELEFAQGGVLCAAASFDSIIVSGYTSGVVRLCNLTSQENCTFTPSSTALNLNRDEGTNANIVTGVAVCRDFTCSGFSHGFVDVWSNEKGTAPVHTFHLDEEVQHVDFSATGEILAATAGPHVRVESLCENSSFTCLQNFTLESSIKHMKLTTLDVQMNEAGRMTESVDIMLLGTNDTVYQHQCGDHVTSMRMLHCIMGEEVTCLDSSKTAAAVGVSAFGGFVTDLFRVKMYCLETGKELNTLKGHTWKVTSINMKDSPPNMLVTGGGDKVVRVFDLRISDPALSLRGHSGMVIQTQMDEWKVVSGGSEGVVCVWDQRMSSKLWEIYNRHPVGYLHFDKRILVAANIPALKFSQSEEADSMMHRRHRGHLTAYDFLAEGDSDAVLSICRSTYDEPQGYSYNIGLITPYD